jgi:hypothetical protein
LNLALQFRHGNTLAFFDDSNLAPRVAMATDKWLKLEFGAARCYGNDRMVEI